MPREPRKRLTASRVERLTTEKRQQDFADHRVPGLTLRVSGSTGRKTWLVSYHTNGKHRRMKVGTYPATSLAAARKKAIEVRGQVEDGGDPLRAREEKERNSFGQLAREVLDAKARTTRESTIEERERILEAELLPAWGDRPVSEISRRDVVLLTDRIAKRAPTMANRVLALIRLIFNLGLDRGFPTLEANPAHRVPAPGNETGSRDRYLQADEIRALWRALEDETPDTCGAFRLGILTAQRMGSIVSMRWQDVADDLWTIPAEQFKGKRTHLVPLSEEAVEVLEALRAAAASDTWVFPSREGAEKPHRSNWNNALRRLRNRLEIPHWTAHDFRRTFRTHATRATESGGLGASAQVADAVLGHKEATLGFDRYTGDRARYLLHEKREALARWGSFIQGTVEEDDG